MPLLTHSDGQRIVGPHFGALFDIIVRAWAEYMTDYSAKQRAKHSTTTRANVLHDLIVANAAIYFTETNGCNVVNVQGLMLFTIADQKIPVAIRFKKFDRQLQSRNQPTRQSRDFRAQAQLDALGAAYHLEAGYVLDRDELGVQQISLVCPNGNGTYWDIELKETEAVTKVRDLFEPESPDERVNIVRPKSGDGDTRKKPDEDEGKNQ